jgi:HD-GYP domain-containing protein (c-di-GMP phosphodiesterase class II)
MLKKIPVQHCRLGMFLHALEGSWLEHPFWKTRFVLREPADLAKLKASAVRDCVIDTSKGLDVLPEGEASSDAAPAKLPAVPRGAEAAAAPIAPASPATPPTLAALRPHEPPPPTHTLAEETVRAAALVNQSREAVLSMYHEARMGRALSTGPTLDLVNDITESVHRNPGAMVSLVRLKSHDDYSYMHSVAVCALMIALARQLGLDEAQTREAGVAGMMHDMGKALMPLEILNKPGKLTDAEYNIIRTHPSRGHELLVGGDASEGVRDVCLHHHERPDGAGYPQGLHDEHISLLAKMGAVCDVYDAITSNRPYKAGWDPAESLRKMASWRKGQFDEQVFTAFVRSLGIFPTGSLVRLASDRLGIVLDQNPGHTLNPVVKVFFDAAKGVAIAPVLLDLSTAGGSDRIVGQESNAKWNFPNLDAMWAGAEATASLQRKG